MTRISLCPDHSALEVAMDQWSEPFWRAGENGKLIMPHCTACGTFRWPPRAFCPECRASDVTWADPGKPSIYSFTVLPVPGADKNAPPQWRVPVVVEFDSAPAVRLVSVLIDAPIDQVAIGQSLAVEWHSAANTKVPVFRLAR